MAQADESAIYFPTGSSAVKPTAVKKIVKSAGEGAAYHVSGFTDPRGSEEINRRLRADRAEAVKQALVAAGVSADQIQLEDGTAAPEGSSKNDWKLRRASVRYEGGHAAAVASAKQPKATKEEPTAVEEQPAVHSKAAATPKVHDGGTEVAMNTMHTNPTPEPPQTEKPKLEKIKLIYWRALNHALWIVAKQKGFFEEEGFDVDLVDVDKSARDIENQVSKGVQSTNALERGQHTYAAGAVCGFATHEAMAKKEDIVDIGSMIMIPETLVMKKELATAIDQDIRAFKGQKIGDSVSGAGVHDFKYNNVLRSTLEKAGLKDDQDFHITEYKEFDDEYAELLAGHIDIAKVFPPADIEFTKKHPEYVRVPFAKFFPYLPCCRQVITRDQLKNNRGKYVRLLRASIRAHEYIIEHPKDAAIIIGKWLKYPPELVRQSIMSAYVTLTPDPMRKGVELYQRTNDKFTKTKTSTAEYIDTSLYRDALFGLQREHNDPQSQGYYATMVARFKQNN